MTLRARPQAASAVAAESGVAVRKPAQPTSRLAVGASDDRAEREADRMADLAVSQPARPAPADVPMQVQRSPATPSRTAGQAPASVDRALAEPGRPLGDALRRDMEPRFGHDFSSVRVHADAQAAASARDVNARAYTVGDDIVFAPGRFAESTHEGRQLIAHELTHVVQQRGAAAVVQRAPDSDGAETETPQRDTQAVAPAADEAQPLSGAIKIDQLNVITSGKGAFSGFPIAKGIDLNKPGPFNDTTTTGSCVNVHQMQFHLAKGNSSEVKLIRKVVTVRTAGGKTDKKGDEKKPADDGPSEGSVIRPKDSPNVVVADAPGFIGKGDFSKSASTFPVSYDADFELFALDNIEPGLLAKLTYSVKVFKKTPTEAAPVNEIAIKSKTLF